MRADAKVPPSPPLPSDPNLPGRPPLDEASFAAFGGAAEVVAQYRAAASGEARGNLFCVLFDYAINQLQQVFLKRGYCGKSIRSLEPRHAPPCSACSSTKRSTSCSRSLLSITHKKAVILSTDCKRCCGIGRGAH